MSRSEPETHASPTKRPVLWIDVTALLVWSGPPTGIPRVVAEMTRRLLRREDLDVRLCVYSPATGHFAAVAANHPHVEQALRFQQHDPPLVRIQQRLNQGVLALRRGTLFGTRFLPASLRNALAQLSLVALEVARVSAKVVLGLPHRLRAWCLEKPLQFAAGDVILDFGFSWSLPGYGKAVAELKARQGVRYAVEINDLIPWRFPQFLLDAAAQSIRQWMADVVAVADLVLVISKNTGRDLAAFAAEGKIAAPPVEVLYLGTNIAEEADAVVKEPLPVPQDRPYVLCVGTLEVRKNHALLYHVWRKLVEEHPDTAPRLVLVGRPGWLVEDLLELVRRDPLVRDHITILDGLSDVALAELYRNCLFTVYPSLYEGWGLPVSESLAFGKACIASNSSSLPEAGGELCEYHEPMDFARCYELVCRTAFDAEFREQWEARIRRQYQPRSWQQAQEQLVSFLTANFWTPSETKQNVPAC